AVNGSIEIWNLTLVAALIAVITVLPISINGIGVVDASFIWLVAQFGVPFEQGLGYMILLRFLLIPISLFGALIYLKSNSNDKKQQTQSSH
ncbi:MAG: lysylphosphatidylglycerol synthase domain-containing protein, partial [Pseudomonadota bacterium]